MNRRLLYLILLSLVVIGVISLIAIKGPLAPATVQTVQLAVDDLEPTLFGVGTVEAKRSYTIGPTRTGKLQQLLVDHGDAVVAGQLLGKMDPVDLPDKLHSEQLSIEIQEHQIESAQAKLDEARSRLALAKREDRRYRDLVKKKQVSQEVAEAKATEAVTAADQVRAAEADLEGKRHDLQRMRSEVKALQAQIDELELISPVAGVVTSREAEPGSVIVGGVPVLRIIDNTTLWVRVRIEQRGSADLDIGLPAEILLRDQPEKPSSGKVARIELIADSLTEERWVDVSFDQIPDNLAIGILANVTIHLPVIRQASWLPAAAIQHRNRESGVWLVADNKAHFVPVKTGRRTLDGKIQILSGVTTDDVVVSYSKIPLDEGQRLKVSNHD